MQNVFFKLVAEQILQLNKILITNIFEGITFLFVVHQILGHSCTKHCKGVELITDQWINAEGITKGIILNYIPEKQFFCELECGNVSQYMTTIKLCILFKVIQFGY